MWVPAAALNYMLDVDGSHDPEIIGKALEELKQAGYNFDTAYQTAENGDQVVILRDMVVNGKSLNFTKTTDAEGNTKTVEALDLLIPALQQDGYTLVTVSQLFEAKGVTPDTHAMYSDVTKD